MKPSKTAIVGLSLLDILLSMILHSLMNGFQLAFLSPKLFSVSNPFALLFILAAFIFGGMYLFTAAGKIIKSAVK